MCYPYDRRQVIVLKTLVYGNPGEHRILQAGTKAIAHAASNQPINGDIHYWLTPVGNWPQYLKDWAMDVGCGVHTDDLRINAERREK